LRLNGRTAHGHALCLRQNDGKQTVIVVP